MCVCTYVSAPPRSTLVRHWRSMLNSAAIAKVASKVPCSTKRPKASWGPMGLCKMGMYQHILNYCTPIYNYGYYRYKHIVHIVHIYI